MASKLESVNLLLILVDHIDGIGSDRKGGLMPGAAPTNTQRDLPALGVDER